VADNPRKGGDCKGDGQTRIRGRRTSIYRPRDLTFDYDDNGVADYEYSVCDYDKSTAGHDDEFPIEHDFDCPRGSSSRNDWGDHKYMVELFHGGRN